MDSYEQVMSKQYGGSHYKGHKIQPWEIWEAYDMNGWEASALKYLLRYKSKGKPLEDLYKCKHNIDYLIAKIEREMKYVQTSEPQGQSTKVFDDVVQRLQSGTERLAPVVSTKDAFEFWGTPTAVSNA